MVLCASVNTVLRPKRMNMIDSMKHRQKRTRLNDASALLCTHNMTIIIRSCSFHITPSIPKYKSFQKFQYGLHTEQNYTLKQLYIHPYVVCIEISKKTYISKRREQLACFLSIKRAQLLIQMKLIIDIIIYQKTHLASFTIS